MSEGNTEAPTGNEQTPKLETGDLLDEANTTLKDFEDHLKKYYPGDPRLKLPFDSPTGTKWITFKRSGENGRVSNILIEEEIIKQEGNESLRVSRRTNEEVANNKSFFGVIDFGPGRKPVTTGDTQPIVDKINAGLQEFYAIKQPTLAE